MLLYMEKINNIQYEFESNYNSLINSDNLSWENVIGIYARKLYDMLNDEYPKIYYKQGINIYIEALMLKMIDNVKIPSYCELYVITKYPYFIELIYYGKTKKEWLEYRKVLLNDLNEYMGSNSILNDYNKMKTMLTTDFDKNKSTLTTLNYFQYLHGYEYKKELIGIKFDNYMKDTILNNLNIEEKYDFNILSLNMTYNLLFLDSIIVYKNIPRYKQKLLNEDTIEKFIPYFFSKPDIKNDMYEIYDCYNNKLETLKYDKTFIAINYNNGYCTIALNPETKYITKDNLDNLINQKIYHKPSKKDIDNYITINFFNQLEFPKNKKIELDKEYLLLNNILNESFVNNVDKTIDNIKNNDKINKLININEKIYFDIYIDNLKNILVFNRMNVGLYLINYIYPNYNTEMMFNV